MKSWLKRKRVEKEKQTQKQKQKTKNNAFNQTAPLKSMNMIYCSPKYLSPKPHSFFFPAGLVVG